MKKIFATLSLISLVFGFVLVLSSCDNKEKETFFPKEWGSIVSVKWVKKTISLEEMMNIIEKNQVNTECEPIYWIDSIGTCVLRFPDGHEYWYDSTGVTLVLRWSDGRDYSLDPEVLIEKMRKIRVNSKWESVEEPQMSLKDLMKKIQDSQVKNIWEDCEFYCSRLDSVMWVRLYGELPKRVSERKLEILTEWVSVETQPTFEEIIEKMNSSEEAWPQYGFFPASFGKPVAVEQMAESEPEELVEEPSSLSEDNQDLWSKIDHKKREWILDEYRESTNSVCAQREGLYLDLGSLELPKGPFWHGFFPPSWGKPIAAEQKSWSATWKSRLSISGSVFNKLNFKNENEEDKEAKRILNDWGYFWKRYFQQYDSMVSDFIEEMESEENSEDAEDEVITTTTSDVVAITIPMDPRKIIVCPPRWDYTQHPIFAQNLY